MKISIVTPSFNQCALLEQSMRSVLNQEGNGFELEYIVVDGGSTDGSKQLIEKHAGHLAWWCSEPDGGQYAAVNKGFERATGEIFAWINSSDLYFPWTLQSVSEIFQQYPEVDWITSLYKCCIDETGGFRSIQRAFGYSARAFADGLHGGSSNKNFIQQEACFWRRSLWEKIGGKIKSDYKLAADFHLWSEFFQHTGLVGVHAPLAAFRHHGEQRSKEDTYQQEVEAELARLTAMPPREPAPVLNLYPPQVHLGMWGREHIPAEASLTALHASQERVWSKEEIANDQLLFEFDAMERDLKEKEAVIGGLVATAHERLECIQKMQKAYEELESRATLNFQIREALWKWKQKLLFKKIPN